MSVKINSEDSKNPGQPKAVKYTDYHPLDNEEVTFLHGETMKEIVVNLVTDDMNDETDVYFNLKISDPEPEGLKISKKDTCIVNVVGEDDTDSTVKDIQKILEIMSKQETISWLGQFKQACLLHPQVDEEGNIDDITALEAFMHFLSIGWKVLFACVPPARYLKGWFSFVIALVFIGFVTAIVAEFATLFGCVLGIKPAVTAITFVALGTSLPDTFASKTAAQESPNADSAIGNVTGSNSVNVFLGLGLPWTIATIYYTIKGETYDVPSGSLSFSVLLFLITSVLCLLTIVGRRIVFKGELGGNIYAKLGTAGFFVFLWLVYIVLSILQIYDVIKV